MTNPLAGEVDFPLAGEGMKLRFRSSDLISLEKATLPAWSGPIDSDPDGAKSRKFWDTIFAGLDVMSPTVIVNCLRAGLKQDDGKTPPIGFDFEDIPFPLHKAQSPISQALMLSRWGVDAETLAAQLREQSEAADEGMANPIRALMTAMGSLGGLSAPDTGPASGSLSAGTSPPSKSSGSRRRARTKGPKKT